MVRADCGWSGGCSSRRAARADEDDEAPRRPARPLMMESVEPRQMLSVSTNAGGWTVITPAADSRVIYVSSSQGSDQNNGLSQSAPVRTITKAGSLMRDGSADEMLLRRGDTWHETFGLWSKSGRSATEPMVIGAYGSGPRPVVASGTAVAFNTGRSSHPRVDHLAIMGIRFWADARDPSSPTFSTTAIGGGYGLRFADASNDLLIEDCAVQGYATDIAFYSVFGPSTNVRVRRCVVTDAYSKTGNSAGLFAYLANGLTLDGNVFDHNGWNTKVGAVATLFNHDVYIKENVNGFVARGNLFSNAVQPRAAGAVGRTDREQRLPERPDRHELRPGERRPDDAGRGDRDGAEQRLPRRRDDQRHPARRRASSWATPSPAATRRSPATSSPTTPPGRCTRSTWSGARTSPTPRRRSA